MAKRGLCTILIFTSVLIYLDKILRREHYKFIEGQQQRKKLLKSTCGKFHLPYGRESSYLGDRKQLFHQMLVENKRKMIFCEVPKTGSKNWRKVLSSEKLDRLDEFMNLGYDLSMKENNEMFRTLRKGNSYNYQILNTRHPLARLHSTWKDIFVDNKTSNNYQSFVTRILPYENTLSLLNKKPSTARVSFQAFLEWLAKDEWSVDRFGDIQWARISDLCAPCVVKYNLITRIEDSDEYLTKALKELGISKRFPEWNGTVRKHDNLFEFYDQLSWLYLDFYEIPEEIICGIFNKYKLDFHLFGYQVAPFLTMYSTCDFSA